MGLVRDGRPLSGGGYIMSSEREGFERLIKKLEEFEATHTKRNRKEMFILFDTVIYNMLLEFISFTDIKMLVEKTDRFITVTLTDIDTMLLCFDEDKTLLKILSVANAVFIKKNEESVSLEIWFRGWEWEEKSGE